MNYTAISSVHRDRKIDQDANMPPLSSRAGSARTIAEGVHAGIAFARSCIVQLGPVGETPQEAGQGFGSKRLGEKHRLPRQISGAWGRLAGNHDDANVGPPLGGEACEFKAVNGAGHIDVRENDLYIRTVPQQPECLVCIRRFDDTKTGLLEDIDVSLSHKRFVFDDKNQGARWWAEAGHQATNAI